MRPASFRFCPLCGATLQLAPADGGMYPTCPHCSYVAYRDPKVSAAAMIERDGRLLLVQRARSPIGLWCLPAGFVNADETPSDAVRREALEETGFVVETTRLAGVLSDTTAGVVLVVYQTVIVGGRLAFNADENRAAGFFGEDEIPDPAQIAFRTGPATIRLWRRGRDAERRSSCAPRRRSGTE